jgi:ribosomal protein S18 acetylase RimI-like enzyme
MDVRTLQHCSLAQITEVFNHAFSDYIIPLKLTNEAMAEKMKTENISLELSAGAFDQEQLAGFVLHGYDVIEGVPTVYNGGTGVIPSHRGRAITASIYHHIIPKLQSRGIHHHVLEVISTNKPAISVYEKLGFKKQRELGVYKKSDPINFISDVEIKEMELDGSLFKTFSSCGPSWQNNTASIFRNREGHEFIAAFLDDQIAGCAVYVKATGRVKQLAVHPNHRRKGIGTALISYMMNHKKGEALVLTNIDLNYQPAIAFFQKPGFQQLLTQFEMTLFA